MIEVGDIVIHVTDPHTRNKGKVIGHSKNFPTLLIVRWISGVKEHVHESELRKVE